MNRVKRSEKKNRENIFLALILVAALLIHQWGASSLAAAKAQYGGLIQARLTQDTLSVEQVKKMRERRDQESERSRYVAWTQKRDMELTSPDLDRKIRLDQSLFFYGDNEGDFSLLLDNGCSLSADLAERLFGTAEGVEGEVVQIENIRYIIERVDSLASGKGVFKVPEKATMGFNVVNVRGWTSAEALTVEELLWREGVSGKLIIDYDQLMDFFSAISSIPLWLVLIGLLFLWRKRQKQEEAQKTTLSWIKKIIRIVCSVGLLFMGYWILGPPICLPAEAIPTRWSNFSFWTLMIERYQDRYHSFIQLAVYGPDQDFCQYLMKLMMSGVGSAVLMAVGIIQIVKKNALIAINATIERSLLKGADDVIKKISQSNKY